MMKIRLPKRYAKFEQFLLAMVDGLKRRGSDFASAAAFDSFWAIETININQLRLKVSARARNGLQNWDAATFGSRGPMLALSSNFCWPPASFGQVCYCPSCILLPWADELAFVFQSECIWKPTLSSRPSLAMKRMQSRGAWSLLLSAHKAQLDMIGSRDILKYVVKVFSFFVQFFILLISEQIRALLAFLTGPGINSWKPWRWITDDYGAMYCCSVKGYSII